MTDDYLRKNEAECTAILKDIFEDALNFYEYLVPAGWINSDYIHFLHPTPKQQFDEHKLITDNINSFLKKESIKIEDQVEMNSFKQDELIDIHEFEEFLYILGLTVYDIFSNNHDVLGFDNKPYELGSMRGSGRFLAEFLNENYPSVEKKYEYIDFYMGTIWIKSRADLTPFYEFVFQKLKKSHCEWNYSFPRMYLIDTKNIFESSETQDFRDYKPEAAVIDELGLSEDEQKAKNLQEKFDRAFDDEFEEAKYKPLIKIVQAYKNVYGVLPHGHPQKEFE
jgi:hypothetical protein